MSALLSTMKKIPVHPTLGILELPRKARKRDRRPESLPKPQTPLCGKWPSHLRIIRTLLEHRARLATILKDSSSQPVGSKQSDSKTAAAAAVSNASGVPALAEKRDAPVWESASGPVTGPNQNDKRGVAAWEISAAPKQKIVARSPVWEESRKIAGLTPKSSSILPPWGPTSPVDLWNKAPATKAPAAQVDPPSGFVKRASKTQHVIDAELAASTVSAAAATAISKQPASSG